MQNFTKLNDRFKQRVEEMSEKLAKLQRDITDLVDSQGQQVDVSTLLLLSGYQPTTITINKILYRKFTPSIARQLQ